MNLYAPVSGIIKEQNKILDTNSSIINSSPYNDGWVYKIEPSNWLRENQLLFMADKQKRFIKHEFSRLKDFLAVTLKADPDNYTQIVLQDGGELRDKYFQILVLKYGKIFRQNLLILPDKYGFMKCFKISKINNYEFRSTEFF